MKAGQCAAINVRHWDAKQIRRGHVVTIPDYFSPQHWFVVRLQLLAHDQISLKNGAQLKFHTGTSEVTANVYLLEDNHATAGQECLAQFYTKTPLVAGPGDHFIIRSLSPVRTIGGGVIVEGVERKLKRTAPGLVDDVRQRCDAIADTSRFIEYAVRKAPRHAASELFALPEALYLVLDPRRAESDGKNEAIKDLRITRAEARAIAPVIARQSVQGFLIGVMPGAGATLASFLGYAVERNIAKGEEQEEFGKGSIKGLAAPETANNAACTGSFVPLLTLGIPGSGTTAILLGALIALNVNPGPRLMIDNPSVFWSVIISMYIGNAVLLILNLPLIPYIAKLLTVPRNYLIPFILFFTMVGAYIGQNNATELLLLVGLGVCATILRFADYPLPPLLIGFILGGMMENNFARSVNLTDGIAFMYERPMTLCLLIFGLLLIFVPAYRRRRARALQQGVALGD